MDHLKFLKITGTKGGNATKKKYNKKYYSKIGKLGSEARWGRQKKKK